MASHHCELPLNILISGEVTIADIVELARVDIVELARVDIVELARVDIVELARVDIERKPYLHSDLYLSPPWVAMHNKIKKAFLYLVIS